METVSARAIPSLANARPIVYILLMELMNRLNFNPITFSRCNLYLCPLFNVLDLTNRKTTDYHILFISSPLLAGTLILSSTQTARAPSVWGLKDTSVARCTTASPL